MRANPGNRFAVVVDLILSECELYRRINCHLQVHVFIVELQGLGVNLATDSVSRKRFLNVGRTPDLELVFELDRTAALTRITHSPNEFVQARSVVCCRNVHRDGVYLRRELG